MLIQRTEKLPQEPSRRSLSARKTNKGEMFAETVASIIEVDVVEVGDGTEDKKKQQRQQSFSQSRENPEQPQKSSLDIKA